MPVLPLPHLFLTFQHTEPASSTPHTSGKQSMICGDMSSIMVVTPSTSRYGSGWEQSLTQASMLEPPLMSDPSPHTYTRHDINKLKDMHKMISAELEKAIVSTSVVSIYFSKLWHFKFWTVNVTNFTLIVVNNLAILVETPWWYSFELYCTVVQ